MRRLLLVGLTLIALPASGHAADIAISDIKGYLFLEKAGKLSNDIMGGGALTNVPKGGGPGGDSASGVMLDFVFTGDKNSQPKYAVASIDVTTTNKSGQRVVTHKAFANFAFGPDGTTHKPLFLENSTCMNMIIEVHAGKSRKDAKLAFVCN